jgi:NADH-quinone oxidoreductase subunit J
VINLGTIAVFYLVLNAPFLAMVQVAVYAGAIMVLFLFVIMLLGAEKTGGEGKLKWQRPLALILTLALIIEGAYVVVTQATSHQALSLAVSDSDPVAVGQLLFDRYLLPFEATSVLLLVAMLGAIVLTLRKEEESK